ncbi:MAG: DUF4230 domain-containing protein [Phycisphaerales bacterium]
MTTLLAVILILVVLLAALTAAVVLLLVRRKAPEAPVHAHSVTVAERVRSVGKLVGLEVHAKEIATSTKGWSWLPPIILSQAKIAMIFHFEKQYFVDLNRLRAADVEELSPADPVTGARARFRIHMPPIEGQLRLTDVTPYDIQAGRILGLVELIQMNAQMQGSLMRSAQDQAGQLFETNAPRYEREAVQSIERRLESFLRLFDAELEITWPTEDADATHIPETVEVDAGLQHRLATRR